MGRKKMCVLSLASGGFSGGEKARSNKSSRLKFLPSHSLLQPNQADSRVEEQGASSHCSLIHAASFGKVGRLTLAIFVSLVSLLWLAVRHCALGSTSRLCAGSKTRSLIKGLLTLQFLKRKAGLIKKAWELSVLCSADVRSSALLLTL